ncbi:MAG: proline--tRNA ligase [Candidatus Woesearchaeota archaeon]
MPQEKQIGITVKKAHDLPEWYNQVILKSEFADHAPVSGCMVIRPLGYAVWENIVKFFDANIKKHGVRNAYFPLFIPESFFKKEAEHAEGFKAEVAWVAAKDDSTERLALRPTSETIIYDSYAKWIRSWRDLPLRINQWCNIVRWEVKDVKLFLRSREFLWQEGHCVYESEEECHKETLLFLEEYRRVAEELLAIPVITGQKTEKERFAGALRTYTIEGFMPDGKGLQLGTSHDLGTGFAKAFGIRYLGRDEKEHVPWQNSWGISTRLIGGMIMCHSDDKGLVLPPNVAPIKVVIVPILFDSTTEQVLNVCRKVKDMLLSAMIECVLDDRPQYTPGWKYNEWELKGVPIRLEIGPKDIEKNQAVLVRRDTSKKNPVSISGIEKTIQSVLSEIQKNLYDTAKKHLTESIVDVKTWVEFVDAIARKKLVLANFCGREACESDIKDKTNGVTSRCIPLEDKPVEGACINCGEIAGYKVYFARSY